jgi:hypothetical protein
VAAAPKVIDPRAPYNNLELIMTTEMRPHNMQQGYLRGLYEMARGENPITYDVSRDILALKKGSRIAIVTGIVIDKHLPKGEVDGPIGAAVLGRALAKLGHKVDLLMESQMEDVAQGLIKTLGYDGKVVLTDGRSADEVKGWANDYDAAVTVEKLGRNSQGLRHSVNGMPLAKSGDYYIDDFIEAMNDKGKLTIGIGDGGNEIGFGKMYADVQKVVLYAKDCGCPCHGGIATTTATKHMIPAAVSNYGAYTVAAALALAAKDPDLMVDGAMVKKLIEGVIALGCLDGGTVDPKFIGDDLIPIAAVMRTVDQMGSVISQWNTTFSRNF